MTGNHKIDDALRTLVGIPCLVLHRTWRIPIWNRSTLLTCPIAWLCHTWPRFANWYMAPEEDTR